MPGHANGTAALAARMTEPASMGARTPSRSVRRPMLTANSIGRSEYSAMSAPTVNGVSPRRIAYSDTATRVPAKVEWLSTDRSIRT